MKVVVPKNCTKKVSNVKQKKTMVEIGKNAYCVPKPKVKMELKRTTMR